MADKKREKKKASPSREEAEGNNKQGAHLMEIWWNQNHYAIINDDVGKFNVAYDIPLLSRDRR